MVKSFSLSRRSFFRNAAALGGAAVVLALGDGKRAAEASPTPPKTGGGAGYRVTEHVAKYYEKARA